MLAILSLVVASCVTGLTESRAGLFRNWLVCPTVQTCDGCALQPCTDPCNPAPAPPATEPGPAEEQQEPPADPAGGLAPAASSAGAAPSGAASFQSEIGGSNVSSSRFRRQPGNSLGIGAGGGGLGGGFGGVAFGTGLATATGSTVGGPVVGGSGSGGGDPGTITPPGGTPFTSIPPIPGTNYNFQYTVTPGGSGTTSPIFFDPPGASGYDFRVLSGPNFASVEVPSPIPGTGQSQFTLIFGSSTETLTVGVPFDFTTINPAGVTEFTITGIVDNRTGNNGQSQAFDTGLTFVGGGDGSFQQTPLYPSPEPGTLTLCALGAAGLWCRRAERHLVRTGAGKTRRKTAE